MSSYYVIIRSDLAKSCDRPVHGERRVNRAAAAARCAELNRKALTRYGRKAPLYYLRRIQTKGE